MLTTLAIIFVFGLMIMIHEMGHFFAAKWHGIKVLDFSFGFGPKIIGFQGRETFYALRAIPFGGFVRLYGMDPEIDDNGVSRIASASDTRSYQNKKIWQRMTVLAAGPLMNFVLAVLLFIIVFAFVGVPAAANGNAIGTLIEGKPAQTAGLKTGDKIVAVNSVSTPDWETLTKEIHSKPNQTLILTIERGKTKAPVKITTEKDSQTGFGMIGIAPEVVYQRVSIVQSIRFGFERTWDFTKLIVVTLGQLVQGKGLEQVGGPVAIAQMIGEGARQGWADLLGLTGILSIQLGIFNLLPIPALDGGHLLFLTVEGLRRKPLNPEKQNLIHLVGFVLLLALMLAMTYRDIVRIFVREG